MYVSRKYDLIASVTKVHKDLGWETLEQRRKEARVVMGFKIIHLVTIPIKFIPAIVHTRANQMKFVPIPTKNYYKYSFFSTMIPL